MYAHYLHGRTYQDPHTIIDDYGNHLDMWEVIWSDEHEYTVAAAMYFKHGYCNMWPESNHV